MSKASYFAELLKQGKTIERYKEGGNSMLPIIKSNQPVTLSPEINNLKVNDLVFCKVKGNYYTHKIKAIKTKNSNTLYLISNNKGRENGWITKKNIFGIVTKIWNN